MKRPRGFTLIELLVVVSIISLLSSVVLSSLNTAREKARTSKARAELSQIRNALNLYMLDNSGRGPRETPLPTSGSNIDDRWHAPDCKGAYDVAYTGNDWPNQRNVNYFSSELAPYMSVIPNDPWGIPYWVDAAYNCTGGAGDGCGSNTGWVYALVSSGPNRNPNGAAAVYESDNIVNVICTHGS